MEEAVIVRAKRTPIYKKNGRFGHLGVHELLSPLLRAVGGDVVSLIDDVIISNAVTPGGNVARLAALHAGFPETVPGITLDRQCSGGLDAVRFAAALIESGMGHCYITGAAESPSTVLRPRAMFSTPEIGDPDMTEAAENVARRYRISRKEQDAYKVRSFERAWCSWKQGFFKRCIVPVTGCASDEAFKRKRPMQRLVERARPLKAGGTVTAANSSGIHDGAAVLLIMSRSLARKLSLTPVLTIISGNTVGFSPLLPSIGPVKALSELMDKQHMVPADLDRIEVTEAFAVKIVAAIKLLHLQEEQVNCHGGALTIGHPFSASGIILCIHLFYQALEEHLSYVAAATGSGGGVGTSLLFHGI
ncbi:acetyl-CoA C-acyltransferase [Sporolactobacillus sp. KGMB 08714]|uniref:acetyl-CoA C-acyltransferase n=1 Tax=Sporolactobacillus sp. KGMB 08714 TaxID=3064704 RepID=UPI002FBDB3CC